MGHRRAAASPDKSMNSGSSYLDRVIVPLPMDDKPLGRKIRTQEREHLFFLLDSHPGALSLFTLLGDDNSANAT